MKTSSVRGTPYTHRTVHGLEDTRGSASPSENRGSTVHEQFREQGINTERRDHATPYNSERGNPADARREVLSSTNAESADHGNQNDPQSNGPTVLLDVSSLESGSVARRERTLDSPVPEHAPEFDPGFIVKEDRAHLGKGIEHLTGDLIAGGGVMSRGLDSTSHPEEDEFEMTRDDTLKQPEAGTAKDVEGHAERRIRE